MTMTRRRLLDNTFKKTVVGNPAIATDSLARRGPGIAMQGWTEQDGTPSPENPVPIISAGNWNEAAQKWDYEVEVGCGQLAEDSVVSHPEGEYVPDKIIFSGNITGEYTISLEEVGEVSYTQPGAGIIKITINGKDEIVGKYQLPYTFSGNITEITVFSSNSYIMFTGTIKFMLNPGSTPLPYTPYRPPQTVTLTADRPLTKWDRLEKRNGQWGWVYKSNRIEMDGSETGFNENYLPILILGMVPTGVSTDRGSSVKPRYDIWSNYTDILVWSNSSCNECSINLDGSGFSAIGVNSADTFKQWLAQKYSEGNSFYYEYETAEETFDPLTTAEQEAMNALYTYRPTTVLSNQQDCQMTLTYKTRKGVGGG